MNHDLVDPNRMPRAQLVGLLLGLGLMLVPESTKAAGEYYTTQSVLKEFFRSSERVTFTRVKPASYDADFRELLGYRPAKVEFIVFVAYSGTHLDGYAVVDDERGQHQPITFAIKLSPEGKVERSEVMVYREGYGEEIREERFRRQFSGKSSRDVAALDHDVVAISGATISSRSMTMMVRRAIALVEVVRRHGLADAPPTAMQVSSERGKQQRP